MKHREVYRVWGRKTREPERFERWLMEDRLGLGKLRNGTRAQQFAIYENLENAARAPFDTDAKVSVLSSLFSASNPQKSLLVLNALLEMAKDGSEHAREKFESLAVKWVEDPTIRHLSMREWTKGLLMALRAADELDSPGLKRELKRVSERDPEAGVQIMFWMGAAKLGCGVL